MTEHFISRIAKNVDDIDFCTEIYAAFCSCSHDTGAVIEISDKLFRQPMLQDLMAFFPHKYVYSHTSAAKIITAAPIAFAYLDISLNKMNNYINELIPFITNNGCIFIKNVNDKSKYLVHNDCLANVAVKNTHHIEVKVTPYGLIIRKKPNRLPYGEYYVESYGNVKNWTLIKGHEKWGWGDITAQYLYSRLVFGEFGVILMAPNNKQVYDYISSQYGVQAVVNAELIDPNLYCRGFAPIMRSDHMVKWLTSKGFEINKYLDSSLTVATGECGNFTSKINPLNIPSYGKKFTREILLPIKNKDFILIQPYSVRSCTYLEHWTKWEELIERLANETKYTIIICGNSNIADFKPFKNKPNIIDLSNRTPTVFDMLWLSTYAKYTITTANCLSLWIKFNQLPGTVIGTAATYFPFWYNMLTLNTPENYIFVNHHEQDTDIIVKDIMGYLNRLPQYQ